MLTVEFGGLETKFVDLQQAWQSKRSGIKERFDKEMLDLITEVENNKSDKLKEQLSVSAWIN